MARLTAAAATARASAPRREAAPRRKRRARAGQDFSAAPSRPRRVG